ncbi:MAG: glycosyltransferase family 1 protein [Candidatus Margulisiibacteriota bacterium]|jgi:glycosyltransferase involved in cell wall biosynthesis
MKVMINALSAKLGGGITYIQNIVPRLVKTDPDKEYELLVSNENYEKLCDKELLASRVKIVIIKVSGLINRLLKEQLVVPWMIYAKRIDVLFCPANIVPFLAPCKKVLWIQNIDPFVQVAGEPLLRRLRIWLLKQITVLSMRFSDVVIFSSNYSRELALKATGIDRKKTRRIFLGADVRRFSIADEDRPRSGILSVSNISGRKNYEILIKAYDSLPPEIKKRHKLKLVGAVDGKYRDELLALCVNSESRGNIIFTGMLTGDNLTRAYAESLIFVLPSLVESFSLPIIEAMAAGMPVIASNATCLPEMIGTSGLTFDPFNQQELAELIVKLIGNEALRRELSDKGREKAQKFTWDNTVIEIIKLFGEMK